MPHLPSAWRSATVALGLAAITMSTVPAMADAAARSLPTVVLVHGAWADTSSWDGVIAQLQQRGYPVVAAANPLRSLSGDAAYIASVVKGIRGKVILVGHSYGGAVITNAAREAANVKALVYVAAVLPDKGESTQTVLDPKKYPGSLLGPATLEERPYADTAGKGVDLYVKQSSFPKVIAADLPTATARRMGAAQRPFALAAYAGPSGTPAWKKIPAWDIVTTMDKAIPPAGQRWMAKRAKAHVVEVRSSHAISVSHPVAVAYTIVDADRHTR
ncbi:Pimeloyl-ACP methyl ester carboxylesterase [Streptosporangium subroseum]|uniref:Pimeloyl-ACP methyl ester carboxylesterase n=1 Tax=Streptosporangium subroseum TaxID=106412 RepID=A0A239NME3_9ACTN|nr:alpha/beta hydrolase [Streptosporangium subroseum]SNT55792.1 Pimeloyl-ACP methyl ester carboxylesterase [Streptosporangium subroseum]